MATLTADVTDVQRTFTVTDPGSPRVGAYYAIEDEVVALAGFCGGGYVGADWVVDETCWYVARGIEGTLAAAHDADATVTEFDVTAGGGGVSNPLTEDLVVGGNDLHNVSVIYSGPGTGGNLGFDGDDVEFSAGSGAEDIAGGSLYLTGGNGDSGNGPGASITVGGGDGAGTPGAITFSHLGPVIPLTIPTVQDVIDALVALGLVSQSD
jgi:hypothetical protein